MAHSRRTRIQPYQWLGVGAVTAGLTVAMVNGIGAAHARGAESNSSSPSSSASASPSSSSPSATSPRKSAKPTNRSAITPVRASLDPPTAVRTRLAVGNRPSRPGRAAPLGDLLSAAGVAASRRVPAAASAAPTYPAVVAEINVDGSSGVAVSPDGTRAYVTRYPNTVSVIDTATNTLIGKPIPVGLDPNGVVVTPNGARVYVANTDDNTVSVIDTSTNTVVGQPIRVGKGPEALAVSPDGSRVYVGNSIDGTVNVIDTAANAVLGDAIVIDNRRTWNTIHLAVSPDGSRLYVTHFEDPDLHSYVSVVDTATNTVVADVATGLSLPGGMAISPNGKRLYVSGYHTDGETAALSVIDTATNTAGAPLILTGSENPKGLVVSPDGTKVYMAITKLSEDGFAVIDAAKTTILGMVITHGHVADIAVTSNGKRVYTSSGINIWVNVVDPTVTGAWTTDPGGGDPGGGDPDGGEPGSGGSGGGGSGGNPRGINWDDVENTWESVTFWAGFVPVVGTVLNGISLLVDFGQAVDAWNRRDADDLTDEIGDLTNDVIGLVPFGKQLTKANKAIGDAVKNVGGAIADWVIDTWW